MSISTYSELQTAVANWLQRDNLNSIIPDLIMLGEKRILRKVRVRSMESELNGTISNGVLAVPDDYLDLKFVYLDAIPTIPLRRVSGSQVYQQFPYRSSVGKPQIIGRQGDNFIFGPYPDSTYTVKGIYYAKPESIQTSANDLFLDNPDLYLFAALAEAAPYLKDDNRIQLWEAKREAIIMDLDNQDVEEYSSGGGMAVTTA